MMIFWNQHWINPILTLSTIDPVSATVPAITLAGTSLIKTSPLLWIPEKKPNKLTSCSKYLGFRIPLPKRESAQPFNICFKSRTLKKQRKYFTKLTRPTTAVGGDLGCSVEAWSWLILTTKNVHTWEKHLALVSGCCCASPILCCVHSASYKNNKKK